MKKAFASTAKTELTQYDYELYLFGLNNQGKANDLGYFKIKHCTIQDEEDNFVRDFIPCKNPDGVVGMYDQINGKFYGSSSGTAFEPGPAKEA